MGMKCNPVLAIQFTNVDTGKRVLVGPFIHAAIMSDIVIAVRVGAPDDEIIATCDGVAWYCNNRPYTDFEVMPWIDGVHLGEMGEEHVARWS